MTHSYFTATVRANDLMWERRLAAWFTTFHHYDALDAGAPPPNPYPNAA